MLSCMTTNVVLGSDFSATYNGKTIYYNILSSTAKTVEVALNTTYSGNITIPSTVTRGETTYTVVGIHGEAFSNTSVTTVNIPNSVETIGNYAFNQCRQLTKVTLGNSVTSIGNLAFHDCALSSIAIPNSVVSIGQSAFANTKLTSIKIPNSVTSIGSMAFYQCKSLQSVELSSSVISIGYNAFGECSNLTDIRWTPNSKLGISLTVAEALISTNRTLYLYMDGKNNSTVESLAVSLVGKFKNIIVERESYALTVSSAGMSTLYLDYPVTIPDNDNLMYVCYISGITDNILYLKKLKDVIPANTGVIITANQSTVSFPRCYYSETGVSDNMLTGVTEETAVEDISGTVYTLGHGKHSGYMGFFKYTGTTLAANKAFLVLKDGSSVNSFNLVLDNEDGTSSTIGQITADDFIQDEVQVIYDLQGRRVEHPAKGIYIVNGRKVMYK